MENPENSPSLPLDLWVEILLLLSLECVLKCKLVSKAWKNLIEDSVFIKLYKVEPTTFILQENALCCLFRGDDASNYCMVRRVPVKLKSEDTWRRYLYSQKLNKVVCVKYTDNCFHLYNLLSGDVREIDDVPYREFCWSFLFCGFGYDSKEDDYKIFVVWPIETLCMMCYPSQIRGDIEEYESENCISVIFVYSYRNRGWHTVKGFPNYLDYEFDRYNSNISKEVSYYFSGHIHYIVGSKELPKTHLVAALDVHDYRLAVFAPPPPFLVNYSSGFYLTELDGSLCCTEIEWGWVKRMDVWVMKEYGVAESWTKLFSLSLSGLICTLSWHEATNANFEIHKCGDETEFLLLDDGKRRRAIFF